MHPQSRTFRTVLLLAVVPLVIAAFATIRFASGPGTAGDQVAAQAETPSPSPEGTEPEATEPEATEPEATETEIEAPGDITEGAAVSPPVATPGGDLPGDVSIELVQVADGLIDPVNVVFPPDDSERMFVVERHGRIMIVEGGEVLDEPFLDITGEVLAAFLEQGLYDMAFHPDFANNGLFYIHYAELLRNGDSLIVEYQVSEDDPNVADPESANAIMVIDQPYANHNGGELAFGPDGYLYIGMGDGGWEGDPLEAGQDLSTLLGKLLRIDVNLEDEPDYGIPDGNPFIQDLDNVELFGIPEIQFAQIHPEARPEIWAWGLRNPWKFSFDPETGDLYLPDVGQNQWEEINFQPADSDGGENYGWDFLMGSHCFPVQEEECASVGILPVAEYSHDLGCAVVGIGVYRAGDVADLDGVYFSGDYCSGRIWGLAPDQDAEETGQWIFDELLDTDLRLTGAGQDPDGNLYVTSCECEYGGPGPTENPPGALWQIVPADQVPEDATTAPTGGENPEN